MDADDDGIITMDEFNTYCDDNDISASQKKDMLKTMLEYQLQKDMGIKNTGMSQIKMPQFEIEQSQEEEFYNEDEIAEFFNNFDYESYMSEAESFYGTQFMPDEEFYGDDFFDEAYFDDIFSDFDFEGYWMSEEEAYFGGQFPYEDDFMYDDFEFSLTDEDIEFLEGLFDEFVSYFGDEGISFLENFLFGDNDFESYFDDEEYMFDEGNFEFSEAELPQPPEFEDFDFNNMSQETFTFNSFKQVSNSYTKPMQNLANAKIELRV